MGGGAEGAQARGGGDGGEEGGRGTDGGDGVDVGVGVGGGEAGDRVGGSVFLCGALEGGVSWGCGGEERGGERRGGEAYFHDFCCEWGGVMEDGVYVREVVVVGGSLMKGCRFGARETEFLGAFPHRESPGLDATTSSTTS